MIGNRIKKRREEMGYTISELAKESGISKSYISNIERNLQKNPSIQFLYKIAEPLDTNIGYLLLGIETDITGLDEEWIELLQDIIESGITKSEFREFQIFVKYRKWLDREDG
ncbi:XRE family transcriptional regulator, master regulator for biofilm formation [Salinibacillus kushneri]|uniref:XRE family transcriptional regulator, master regulator for biofilm formation n=1 Tax=Salinibacillus kushneri TaxID=237682 RepID=A0A1I0JH19_9BACI|nr:helix-turn-helix domain-containing protein [Salinibacillus kushneri]SEU09527.1 XRE family transcriptional regulator, master regulator for biofilm formation [Salinibacillus kushneri]